MSNLLRITPLWNDFVCVTVACASQTVLFYFVTFTYMFLSGPNKAAILLYSSIYSPVNANCLVKTGTLLISVNLSALIYFVYDLR